MILLRFYLPPEARWGVVISGREDLRVDRATPKAAARAPATSAST